VTTHLFWVHSHFLGLLPEAHSFYQRPFLLRFLPFFPSSNRQLKSQIITSYVTNFNWNQHLYGKNSKLIFPIFSAQCILLCW
jgi:hypothetical protein